MTDFAPVIRLPKSKVDTYQDTETLVSDTLFLKNFPSTIYEQDLRQLLENYQPVEIVLDRQSGEGHIIFPSNAIADQVYALYQDYEFHNGTRLFFAIEQDATLEAQGQLLRILHLPHYVENNMVYQLFRPYGPLALCKLLLEPDDSSFHGSALVQYFYQEDTNAALNEMDGQYIDGNTISVEPLMMNDYYQKPSPMMVPDKANDAVYVDMLNLYIKNLDAKVTNADLFNAFRTFGRIVSARVMSNPSTGQSKGYGFVSYSRPEEAKDAIEQMHGKIMFSKPLIISYHTPKKPRQQTSPSAPSAPPVSMPQQQQQQQHHQQQQQQQQQQPYQAPRHQTPSLSPTSTMTPQRPLLPSSLSPTSPSQPTPTPPPAATPGPGPSPATTNHAAAAVSPVLHGLGIDNVEQLAMDIKELSVGHKYQINAHPLQRKSSNAAEQAMTNNSMVSGMRTSPPFSSSPISGSTTGGHSLASLASGLSIQQPPAAPAAAANGHPRNEYKQTADGRPSLRRRSSLESISTVMTESTASLQRQKMSMAVAECLDDPTVIADVVDMLLTLKKKERSLCLFNQDFLKSKIELALEALEVFQADDEDIDDEDEELQQMMPRQPFKKPIVPSAPSNMYGVAASMSPPSPMHYDDIPKVIPKRVSRAIPIVPPPPAAAPTNKPSSPPAPPKSTANGNGNGALAPKPAASAPSPSTATNGRSKSLTAEQQGIVDMVLRGMENKPSHEQKQLLGDRLFPLVKASGTKQAAKITIRLLDTVDLHELTHLMFDKDELKKHVDQAFASLNK